MAKKKKKLNKKVVIVLSVLGLFMLTGGALSVERVRNKLFPKDPVAAAEKAAQYAQDGDYEQADKYYGVAYQFSDKHPQGAEYAYQSAKLKIEWARQDKDLSLSARRTLLSEAWRRLDIATRRDRKFIKAQQLICDIQWSQYRPGISAEDYVKRADKLIELIEEKGKGGGDLVYYRRAIAKTDLVQTGTTSRTKEDALADFDKAIELKKDEVDYRLGKAAFLERLPHEEKEKIDAVYQDAIKAIPQSPRLRVQYSKYLYSKNFRDDALTQLNKAIEIESNSTDGLQILAVRYMRDNRPVEAKDTFLRALTIDPGDYRIRLGLVRVYRYMKDLPGAIAIVREGLKRLDEDSTTSQPATAPVRFGRFDNKSGLIELSYALANALMDQLGQNQISDRAKAFEEIQACLDKLQEADVNEAIRESLAGRLAYAQGNMDEARVHLEKAYELFKPNLDQSVSSLLVNIYGGQGQAAKAEAIIDRYLASNKYRRDIRPRLGKAQILMGYHKYAEAQRYVADALTIAPENSTAKMLRGTIAILTGQATRLPDDVTPNDTMLGQIVGASAAMWTDDRRDDAIGLLESLQQRAPGNMTVLYRLVTMYQATNQPDKALVVFQQAKAVNPDATEDIQFMERLLTEKDPAKQVSMQIDRTSRITDLRQRHLARANIYKTAGMKEQYIQSLQAAHKINPESPDVVGQLFQVAIADKDWTAAEQLIAAVAKTDSDKTRFRLYAANLARAQGKIDEAIAYLTEVLEDHPNLKHIRVQLGSLFLSKQELTKAENAFRIVAVSDPGYTPAVIGMVHVTRAQGGGAEYEDWLQRAYRLAPRNPQVAEYYSQLMERTSADPQPIIARREKRLSTHPDDLQNRLGLGQLYERVGQKVKAEQMYRYVYENTANRLIATDIMRQFLSRNGRLAEADEIIQNLLKTAKDRVGAYILYGRFLTPHKPAQAKGVLARAIELDSTDPRGHLAMARFLGRSSPPDFNGAAEAMKNAILVGKSNPALEKELIGYEIFAKNYEDATKRLELILTADASDVRALWLKAQLVLLREKNIDKAIDLLTQAVTIAPDDADSFALRARLYLAKGELSAAKADLQTAKRITNSAQIALELADVYSRMQEWNAAESVLRELLGRQKNLAPAIDRLITIYMDTRDWSALEKLLAEAREFFPKDSRYPVGESVMWQKREMPAKKLAALKAALEITPENVSILRMYLLSLLKQEKYDEVLKVSVEYTGKANIAFMVDSMRAQALAGQGKSAQADEIFRKVVVEVKSNNLPFVAGHMMKLYGATETIAKLKAWRKPADDWGLAFILAELYQTIDKEDQAVALLREALKKEHDKSTSALLNQSLGKAYQTLQNFAEAEKAYIKSLSYAPNDVSSLNNLAYMYADKLGVPEKALEYVQKAAGLAPNSANILDTYGWVLARMKRYVEAEKYLQLALVQPDPSAASRYHLGWVYEQQGQTGKAVNEYRLGQAMIKEQNREKDPFYKMCTGAIIRIQSGSKTGSGS